MRTGFSWNMPGARSPGDRGVLDENREGGKGQSTEVLGRLHVEEFLLGGGQQEAICYEPEQK